MTDSWAIQSVFRDRTHDFSRVMIWEHGYDTFVPGDFIGGSSGPVTEAPVIIPGGVWGGGVDGYQESQVLRPAVELVCQFWFPGHAPELCVRACLGQFQQVGYMFGEDVSYTGDAHGGKGSCLGDEFDAVMCLGEVF